VVSMDFDYRQFDRALREVTQESDRADFEIVTMNSRTLAKSLMYNTPIDSGATRAGFWPAWTALGMPGTPGTTRNMTAFEVRSKKRKTARRYVPDGWAKDERRKPGDPGFAFAVRTHMYARGKRINYPYALNARLNFWGAGFREVSFKFGQAYERLCKKHSAGKV